MDQSNSLFSQVLPLISDHDLNASIKQTGAMRHNRGFAIRDQLVSLMFCQLGRAYSLSEICDGLSSCHGKLNHLGLSDAPKKSSLAYVNKHRKPELFKLIFLKTYARLSAELESQGRSKRKFRFKSKLYSLDASVVDLCLKMFNWAHFQKSKGAVKLHLKLDHDGYLPCFAHFTDGRVHDMTVARAWKFTPGTMLVFDKGYGDYAWFGSLCAGSVSFVTRLRDNARYKVVEERPLPSDRTEAGRNVRSDKVIRFNGVTADKCPHNLRVVEMYDPQHDRVLQFLTNNLTLAATTICAIYKDRWQIEIFFKMLKSHLKIKTFLGTSPNAVWTQMWVALLVMLILKYLQLKSTYGWSMSNLVALLRFNLFTHRNLWKWLNNPLTPPEPPPPVPIQHRLAFG